MGNGRQTTAVADYSLIQRTLNNADQWNQFGKEKTRRGKSRWPKFFNWQGVIRLSRFVEREKKASTKGQTLQMKMQRPINQGTTADVGKVTNRQRERPTESIETAISILHGLHFACLSNCNSHRLPFSVYIWLTLSDNELLHWPACAGRQSTE